jgi:hypothetical protein
MGVLVMAESCILALTTGTTLAQGLSTTRASPVGIYAGPSHPEIRAVGPACDRISAAALGPVQPFAFTRVDINIGPLIDMDNSRRQDEDRQKKRQEQLREQARRNEELREHYRSYGYAYPPFTSAYPPEDLYRYDYSNNRYYYDPLTGYYYQPNTGQYYYVKPGSGSNSASHGHSHDARPENAGSAKKDKSRSVDESSPLPRILPGGGSRP